MIRQAVILAAGLGQRIRADRNDLPKPLQPVAGMSLLKRTALTLAAAQVSDVHVVVGFLADRIRRAIDGDPDLARAGVAVHFVDNPDYQLANGVSVLAVRDRVTGPFLLSMSDHVYDAHLPRLAAGCDMDAADLWLCVDRRIAEVYDIDDATKVRTDGDRIVAIGKQLDAYDAIDCGVFAVGPALLDCLAEARTARGDCSLSDGVQALARAGRARVADIGQAFWQDVDTPGARTRAETILRQDPGALSSFGHPRPL